MKAIIWTKYGPIDGLQLADVEKPIPKDNEVLIKIFATTVSMGDCEIRSLRISKLFRIPLRFYFGIRKPRNVILGQELSGEIESIGKDVTKFKIGDHVIAQLGFKFGGYTEYTCIKENAQILLKPLNMTHYEASTLPTWATTALHFILKSSPQKGQKMLIIGACGCIGIFAVQLAKCYGLEVTAVDSTEKLAVLKSVGADRVIDYTKEDFTKTGEKYDIIFDVVGKNSYRKTLKCLNKNGYFLLANPSMFQIIRGKLTPFMTNKHIITSQPADFKKYLHLLKDLIEANKLTTVIDRTYSLEEIPQAHNYVESGQKKGHVVIKIA